MRIVHLIPQLRLGAGRCVVDLAARQARVSGGDALTVLVSADAEPPFQSAPRLVSELRELGVSVEVAGDFFHRTVRGLRDAARQVSGLAGFGQPWLAHAHTVIAATPETRAAPGASGEAFARRQFDVDAAAAAMHALYERVWRTRR
jgi:hypothetical protein